MDAIEIVLIVLLILWNLTIVGDVNQNFKRVSREIARIRTRLPR